MSLKGMLTAYRVFIAVFQVALILLIFLAVYFVASQQVRVEEIGEPDITFDGSSIILKVPVKIANEGLFDIKDITLQYQLRNSSAEFLEATEYLGDVNGGEVAVIPLPVEINLTKLYEMESPNFYHFFHYDKFKANFTLSLKYLFNMVSVTTRYNTTITWKPPVKGYSIGKDYSFLMNSSGIYVNVPFVLDTQSYLWGNAILKGYLLESGEKVGAMNASAQLGEVYHGEMLLHIWNYAPLLTHSKDIDLQGNITLFNFTFPLKWKYHWGAPLANLSYEIDGNEFHYYFKNEAPLSLHLLVNVSYYNDGTLVQREQKEINVHSGEEVNQWVNIPAQKFNKVVISFYDTTTHLSYQEVINL